MRVAALYLLFLVGFPLCAQANPMDHYGLGSRGGGMANACVAIADDWTAPYYNPAGMTRSGETFGLGLVGVASDYVHIRPKGTGKPTDSFERVEGLVIGTTDPLGTENLRIGISLYFPLQRYQMARTYFVDEREALPGKTNQLHFEFYGEREQRQVIIPALAYRFAPWLSLGAGVSILNNTSTVTTVYEPNIMDMSKAIINVSNNTIYTYAPVFGIVSELPWNITLGAVYRGEIAFPIHGPTNITVYYPPYNPPSNLTSYTLYLDFLVNYTPAMASVGASFTGITDILLTGELGWAGWSYYRDNHNAYPYPRLNDVFTPRIGIESHIEPLVLRAGYSYEPSPVPHQSGRTNIVDNASHILTLGVARNFGLNGLGSRVGIFGQARYLVPRTETKQAINNYDPSAPHDTTQYKYPNPPNGYWNPGYPGWESWGWIFATGIDISLSY